MSPERLQELTARYRRLRLVVAGDFCLDRYWDIDPALAETSLETGLPVHNVVRVRAEPGGAGTILNNLAALGVGAIHPVGFCGEDGEGWELRRALAARPGVVLDDFLTTTERHTFTYGKPLIHEPGRPPKELNRLDIKNWTPTPPALSAKLADAVERLGRTADALIVLEQVDRAETGVVTAPVREAVRRLAGTRPDLPIVADSRRGLRDFPPVLFKMNRRELAALTGGAESDLEAIEVCGRTAAALARRNSRPVVVTLAEAGLLAAEPDGRIVHLPALPVRGEIDIVGAGDAVTANLTAALAAGANLQEALELATLAASHVIHQLGVTGTATPEDLLRLLPELPAPRLWRTPSD
ncbi:MAG: carbohydrate kinase [Verrucomicrobia bacterium]|nr:MAG: carbohydrate kinase [Verrucomicrobiota bacterium]